MNEQSPQAAAGTQPAAGARSQGVPDNYKWKVLATVIFGIFMIILDTTVVNVAFQALRDEFGRGIDESQWIISIYVLSLGISTPLAGFLADRFGSKKIYLGGLGLFALGSLLCGLAPSLGLLIVARGIQGLGGGIAMPLGTALLLQAFPVREHGAALGAFGVAALVAPAIGPILGGWLVDHDMWRVIFFINPPIGLLAVVLGVYLLRELQGARKLAFDSIGVVTEVIGFGAILYAASIAAQRGWTSPETLTWFAVGVVGLVFFFLAELFVARAPLLDVRLFANRVFLNASLLGYVSTVALFGAEFLMPVYLQSLRGSSAFETGLVLLPMAIAGGIFVTASGRLYDRVGPRPLMAVGFTLLLINTWQLSRIQADTPIGWLVFLLTLRGLALGLTVQTTFVTALSVVPRRDLARGSSLATATRLVVQSIGVAVLATILSGAVSPESQSFQASVAEGRVSGEAIPGLCEPVAMVMADTRQGLVVSQAPVERPLLIESQRKQACQENIDGFERTYRFTFYAAFLALVLGLMLPGWPGKWSGRQSVDEPLAKPPIE